MQAVGKLLMLGVSLATMGTIGKVALDTSETVIHSVKCVASGLDLQSIDRALQRHEAMEGKYPSSSEFAKFIQESFTTSTNRDVTKDYWKNPFHYELHADGYEIRSRGPDGKLGTDDDSYLVRKGNQVETSLGDPEDVFAKLTESISGEEGDKEEPKEKESKLSRLWQEEKKEGSPKSKWGIHPAEKPKKITITAFVQDKELKLEKKGNYWWDKETGNIYDRDFNLKGKMDFPE